MTGMLRSIRTMSGRSSRYFSSASSPFAASPTTCRSGSVARNATRPARMSGWSSAARTLMGEGLVTLMTISHSPKSGIWRKRYVAPVASGSVAYGRLSPMLRAVRTRVLWTLTCAATAGCGVAAQEPVRSLAQLYHTAWTTRDGAPAQITALPQTADGFLWLGSSTGLFRFDGIRFELFEPPPQQSLRSGDISALLPLRDGGLWVGYRLGGASLIEPESIRISGEGDSLPSRTVLTFAPDPARTPPFSA